MSRDRIIDELARAYREWSSQPCLATAQRLIEALDATTLAHDHGPAEARARLRERALQALARDLADADPELRLNAA